MASSSGIQAPKETRMPRIAPLNPPFEPGVARQLEAMMPPGVPPILLFRTAAKNLPLANGMVGWGSYYLSPKLALSMRHRELVIDRVTALCGCEYEWGVHIAFFAEAVGLSTEQVRSLTHGDHADECWVDERDRLVIEAVDVLHQTSDVDDELWGRLTANFDEPELLDLMLLSGWYHGISYMANGARVDLEDGAPRFADYS